MVSQRLFQVPRTLNPEEQKNAGVADDYLSSVGGGNGGILAVVLAHGRVSNARRVVSWMGW